MTNNSFTAINMVKAKPKVTLLTHGIYQHWDEKGKELPQIIEFTTQVPAIIDIEFGFTIRIEKAKGKQIHYCIKHPNITNEQGDVMPAFTGEVYVKDNNWSFYLGDTIWAPITNKIGLWQLSVTLDGNTIMDKNFTVFDPH